MSDQHQPGVLLYGFSLIIAMCLRVVSLPPLLQVWSPDWVMLVLMYWVLAWPYRWGIFNAWFVGLLMDVLTGRVLGHYALVYALVSYICLKFYQRVRHFPPIQQSVFIFSCLLLAQLVAFSIETIHNPAPFQLTFLLPVLSGTLIWPLIGLVLRK